MKDKTEEQAESIWRRLLVAGVPVVGILLSVIAGSWSWERNAAAERSQQDYVRREARYVGLVSSLNGFQKGGSSEQKSEFLEQLDQCWLYCSDSVIRAGYRFIEAVETGNSTTDAERAAAAGELALEIRRDLVGRLPVSTTTLTAAEYRVLKVR